MLGQFVMMCVAESIWNLDLLLITYHTPQKPFFYNAKYLDDYHKASKEKQS